MSQEEIETLDNVSFFKNDMRYDKINVSDPYPDPHWFCSAGSGSRRTKITQKKGKREENFQFWLLDVLFWGLKASPVAWTSFMED
jgi:hypothetical protein